jgi:hypothetical protein
VGIAMPIWGNTNILTFSGCRGRDGEIRVSPLIHPEIKSRKSNKRENADTDRVANILNHNLRYD